MDLDTELVTANLGNRFEVGHSYLWHPEKIYLGRANRDGNLRRKVAHPGHPVVGRRKRGTGAYRSANRFTPTVSTCRSASGATSESSGCHGSCSALGLKLGDIIDAVVPGRFAGCDQKLLFV
jgi:hypothetical protein